MNKENQSYNILKLKSMDYDIGSVSADIDMEFTSDMSGCVYTIEAIVESAFRDKSHGVDSFVGDTYLKKVSGSDYPYVEVDYSAESYGLFNTWESHGSVIQKPSGSGYIIEADNHGLPIPYAVNLLEGIQKSVIVPDELKEVYDQALEHSRKSLEDF